MMMIKWSTHHDVLSLNFGFFLSQFFTFQFQTVKKRHDILKSGLEDIIGQFVYVPMIIYRDLSKRHHYY